MHANLSPAQMIPTWLGRLLLLVVVGIAAAPVSRAGVHLTDYNFPANSLPQVYTDESLPIPYRLRAKFAGDYHAANGWNNNGQTLEGVPGIGWTKVELYWVKYAGDYSTILQVGPFYEHDVTITLPKANQTVSSQNATTYGNQSFTPAYLGGAGTGAWQFVVAGYTNWGGTQTGTLLPPYNTPSTNWVPSQPGTYTFYVRKLGDANYYDSNIAGPYTLTVQAPNFIWGTTPGSVPSGIPYTVMLSVGNTGGFPFVTLYKNGYYFSANWYGTQGSTSDTGVLPITYLGTYYDYITSSSGSNSRQVNILPSGEVTGPASGVVGTNSFYSLTNVLDVADWRWEVDLPGGAAFEWQGSYGTNASHAWAFGSGAGTYKIRAHLRGPGGSSYTNEVTVTAYYQLSASVSPAGAGSVSGGGLYQNNATAYVGANAGSGYGFTGWSGDLSGAVNPTSLTMNGNKAVTAHFMAVPAILSPGTANGNVGTTFSYQITATNSPNSYSASGLPPGLFVNPATGLITGTPSTAATYNTTVSASNDGGTGSAPLTITIGTAAQNDSSNQNELNIHIP